MLAVATKANILLYETPKGERAFRFVKACHEYIHYTLRVSYSCAYQEFYTPLTSRSITFIYQSVQETMFRSPSSVVPRAAPRHENRHTKGLSMGNSGYNYPHQISLFVTFEKKAGLIRIADAAVSEVELFDESSGSSGSGSRGRASWDGRGSARDSKAWIPPVQVEIPTPQFETHRAFSQNLYVLTRGRQSQILPYPLPARIVAHPPYRSLQWSFSPTTVRTRVIVGEAADGEANTSFLQVIAFGEAGIEVQEIPLTSLSERKGKNRAEEPRRAQADLGDYTGFLCTGGHWDQQYPGLGRSASNASYASSLTEVSQTDVHMHEGIYAWVQKGLEDWRVFWVGGSDLECEEEDGGSINTW